MKGSLRRLLHHLPGGHILTGFSRTYNLTLWLKRGFWAISDQGLYSISNFIPVLVLARWLTPEEYGAFSVAFAVYALITAIHNAVITEPMLVFGSGKYRENFSNYLGVLLYAHAGLTLLGSFLLLLAALSFSFFSETLYPALLGVAITVPFILLSWLMRRACYVRSEPHISASGGAIYMVLMLGGIYALYRMEWLSAASTFEVMGFSSVVVSLWLAVRLRLDPRAIKSSKLVREMFKDHRNFGSWGLGIKAFTWMPGNIFYLLLPLWGGLAAGASLRALSNLIMPVLQTMNALSVLLLPTLVRVCGQTKFRSATNIALSLFICGSAVYWVLLGVFHYPLVAWLYGGQYVEYASLLWILGLVPLVMGIGSVLGAALRAMERPDQVFWVHVSYTAAMVTIGLGLMFIWGIPGAVTGLLVSYTVGAIATWVLYRKVLRARPTQDRKLSQGGQHAASAG
jgi:O-antigen/teichoic acid export membrane protein